MPMNEFLNFFEGLTTGAVAVKLILATLLGSFVGMERANKRYAAGIRTFALVSLGSALATITGIYFAQMSGDAADIGRVPAQILAGIGFLGAGHRSQTDSRSDNRGGTLGYGGDGYRHRRGAALAGGHLFLSDSDHKLLSALHDAVCRKSYQSRRSVC